MFSPALPLACALLIAACSNDRSVAPIERQVPEGAFIANAVRVPAGHELIFHSGIIPSAANPDATPGTVAYWGDMRQQAHSVLSKIKASVEALGLTLGDVVQMTVYLGADRTTDPDARMDFAGFMEVYLQFFGEAAGQPNLPARSTVEVVNFVQPGMLVEIDVTLARPAP
jgi:enamine deaminase RidA (YjgF/YER057c/UK114 family)